MDFLSAKKSVNEVPQCRGDMEAERVRGMGGGCQTKTVDNRSALARLRQIEERKGVMAEDSDLVR